MKTKNLSPNEVRQILLDPSVKIIDVRTPGEFAREALPGAQLLPVQQLQLKLNELPEDKSTPLLIYCAHGMRSLSAIAFLSELGYENLMNMSGGLAHFLGREPK